MGDITKISDVHWLCRNKLCLENDGDVNEKKEIQKTLFDKYKREKKTFSKNQTIFFVRVSRVTVERLNNC